MIITIDGPTASGKSVVASLLARKLGFFYLNSGFLYRAVAYLLINHELYKADDLANPDPQDLAEYLNPERFVYDFDTDFKEQIFFDRENITPFLKTSFIDKGASLVGTNPRVREHLLEIQRVVAQRFDLVAEGRDMGSVVFPEADIKFYLTASAEVRAERWREYQLQKGNKFSFEKAIKTIEERDKRDMERKIAPLVIPDDAIVVDNSELTIDGTVEEMLGLIKKNKLLEQKA